MGDLGRVLTAHHPVETFFTSWNRVPPLRSPYSSRYRSIPRPRVGGGLFISGDHPTMPHAHQASSDRPFRLPPEACPQAEAPVAIPMRIVTAKPPKKPRRPVQRIGGVQEPEPERAAYLSRRHARPRRASARCRTSTPRNTSGAAMPLSSCFGKSCAGPRAMTGRKPERYWRSYGDDPLPAGAEAIDEPFAAFPSWLCGSVRPLRQGPLSSSRPTLTGGICCSAISSSAAPRWLWRPGWQGRVVDRHRGRHQPAGAAECW